MKKDQPEKQEPSFASEASEIKIHQALYRNTSGCGYSLKFKKQSNPLRKQSICNVLAWVGTQESEVIADFTLV